MSVALLHPEELIDRRRRGRLSEEERARLAAHARRCASCALELAAIDDLADAVRPRAGDDALIDRMVARASDRPPAFSSRPPRRRRSMQLAIVAAVALVALIALAAAAGYGLRRSTHSAPPPVLGRASLVAAPRVPKGVPTSLATTEEPATTAPSAPAKSAVKIVASAAEMFTRANALRRAGEYAAAARAYRELQAKHPGAREEITSRVVLAQLLLDRLADANGALALFDSYLAAVPGGGLREEALVGRARALGKLGRATEEASTWRQLLAAYPQSLHAERAKKRLTELP